MLQSPLRGRSGSFTSGNTTSDVRRLRVLVLGDSNVGKTSLLKLLCTGSVAHHTPATVGPQCEVKLVELGDKSYCVEFLEVGGKTKYERARSVLYGGCHAVILVHDLSNRNSHTNLRHWAAELSRHGNTASSSSYYRPSFRGGDDWDDIEGLTELHIDGGAVPVLIIGNKSDLLNPAQSREARAAYAEETGGGSLQVSALQSDTFSPSSAAWHRLHSFLLRAAQRVYGHMDSSLHVHNRGPATSQRWEGKLD